jgi:hypothetical protein
MRGIEVTLSGVVTRVDGELSLVGTSTRMKALRLAPFGDTSQLKWDIKAEAARPVSEVEAGAYGRLSKVLASGTEGAPAQVAVTGTL